jgi:hypothetical protein
VPLGQLGRLPADLGAPRERSGLVHDRRLVRQAGELQVRPPDPAGQRDAAFQVPLRVIPCESPELGAAEADQGQRAQVLDEARLCGVPCLGDCLQPTRLLGGRGQVPPLAGQQQPDHVEKQPKLAAPGFGSRCRRTPG